MVKTIETSLLQLRNNLGAFVEQAYYTDVQIRLMRHNKPIARLVSERFMQNLERILEEESGLQETLEIMMDENMLDMLAESQKDLERGDVRPLKDLL